MLNLLISSGITSWWRWPWWRSRWWRSHRSTTAIARGASIIWRPAIWWRIRANRSFIWWTFSVTSVSRTWGRSITFSSCSNCSYNIWSWTTRWIHVSIPWIRWCVSDNWCRVIIQIIQSHIPYSTTASSWRTSYWRASLYRIARSCWLSWNGAISSWTIIDCVGISNRCSFCCGVGTSITWICSVTASFT